VTIRRCLFASCSAHFFGSLYVVSKATTTIASTNATKSRAQSCVGCIEVKGGTLDMQHVGFSESGAKIYHGCMCTRHLDAMSIEDCFFRACHQRSSDRSCGSALTVYSNPYHSILCDCAFVRGEAATGVAIAVSSGHFLWVVECWFLENSSIELDTRNVEDEACHFLQTRFPTMQWRGELGFARQRRRLQTTGKATPVSSPREWRGRFARNRKAIVISASCSLAALSAVLLTVLMFFARRLCPPGIKVPDALK
jgi:hypothetical protein